MNFKLLLSPFQTSLPLPILIQLIKYKISKPFLPRTDFNHLFNSIYSSSIFTTAWSTEVFHHLTSAVMLSSEVKNVLEVGCWEGASTLFLASFFPEASFTCVDTWEGSAGESLNSLNNSIASSYDRFITNTHLISNRLRVAKGISQCLLPQLLSQRQVFDFIYIDGSHLAADVYVDAYYALKLSRKGTILLFDDFLWLGHDSFSTSPMGAVSHFYKDYSSRLEVLFINYQACFRVI